MFIFDLLLDKQIDDAIEEELQETEVNNGEGLTIDTINLYLTNFFFFFLKDKLDVLLFLKL